MREPDTDWSKWIEHVQKFAAFTCPKQPPEEKMTKKETSQEVDDEVSYKDYKIKQEQCLEDIIKKLSKIHHIFEDLYDDLEMCAEDDAEFEFRGWIRINNSTIKKMIDYEREHLKALWSNEDEDV